MNRLIVIAPDDADMSNFFEMLMPTQARSSKIELSDSQRAERARKARERYHAKKRQKQSS